MDKQIEQLCELIKDITNEHTMTWVEKRDAVLKEIDEVALGEFISWFDSGEKEDEDA